MAVSSNNTTQHSVMGYVSRIRRMRLGTVWLLTVLLFVLGNIMSVAWHILFFTRIEAQHVDEIVPRAVSGINPSDVRETIEFFQRRQATFESIKALPPDLPNPLRHALVIPPEAQRTSAVETVENQEE